MIITEKKNIVGTLLTQGQEFDMLELQPSKIRNVSFALQDDTFEFYVIVESFAQFIVVARGSFAIIPFLEFVEKEVKFVVESEEESIDVTDILERKITVDDLKTVYLNN